MLTVEWMFSGTLRQGRSPSAHSHPRASPTPRLERYGTDFALGTDAVPRCVVGDQIEAAPRKTVLPAALPMSPSERTWCIRRTLATRRLRPHGREQGNVCRTYRCLHSKGLVSPCAR